MIQLEILRYAAGGQCVARHENRVVFIRGVLPGEIVNAEITSEGKGGRFLIADLISVITPSPLRIAPPCKYAGNCGGCDWQHASIETQVQLHGEVIQDQLNRIGKFDQINIEPVLSVPGETGLGYRSRVRYATTNNGESAMRKHGSNELVPIDECLIAEPRLNEITTSNWRPSSEITLVAGSDEVLVLTDREIVPQISYSNRHGQWVVPAGDFWQVHKDAPEVLIDSVLKFLDPMSGDQIGDLYSGVGLFALPIARKIGRDGLVTAVELDHRANKAADQNLKDFDNVQTVESDVAIFLKSRPVFNKVVLDPPRSGLNNSVIRSLNSIASLNQIVYVSCDSGTLARDLRSFADLGWQIKVIQPLLLFPMTAHIETVVHLSKVS